MSTGDQTEYLRTKLAERGVGKQVAFSTDGYDRWAESTEPARAGQMEKVPSDSSGLNYGGAMTLSQAKKTIHKKMGLDGVDLDVDRLTGGSFPGFDEFKKTIEDGVGYARKAREFWQSASKWMNELERELKDEILDNEEYASNKGLKDAANGMITILKNFRASKTIIDQLASGMQALGLGKPRKNGSRVGGASSAETWKLWADRAKKIVEWVTWLIKAAKNLIDLFTKVPALKTLGKEVLQALGPIIGTSGGSRHCGGENSLALEEMPHCECDSPSRKKSVGGAKIKDKMLGEWHAWTSPLENMLAQKLGKYMAQKPRRHEAVNMQMREIADAAMKAAKEGNEELMNKLLALLESKSKEPLGGRKPQMTGGFDLFGEAEKLIKGVVPLPQPDKAVMGVINGGRKRCAQPRSGGQRPPGMPPGWKPAHMYGGVGLSQAYNADGTPVLSDRERKEMMTMYEPKRAAQDVNSPYMYQIRAANGGASCGGRKTSARGAIVKKVMAEHGLSLPQASKYVKEHGLY